MSATNPNAFEDERLAAIDMRIAGIETQLKDIGNTLEFVKSTMVSADTTISKVAAEVMPTINELVQSPMLKMLGVGKKK